MESWNTGSLPKILSLSAGACSSPTNNHRQLTIFSKPGAVEKSTGGKHLPAIIFQGASNSGISPQGASSSSKPMVRGNSKVVSSKVGKLHLEKTKVSGSVRRNLKSQGCIRGIQQLGCIAIPKPGETLTKTPKRARSAGVTPTDAINPPQKPRNSTGPGT
jgi:hypothetical protein